MKTKLLLILGLLGGCLLFSCGSHETINSKEEAIKFIESHLFDTDRAKVSGKSGASLKTDFSIGFENGKAVLNEESIPYTIIEDHSHGFDYTIEFCGSERYAYGECIMGYLSSGKDRKDGPSLSVRGNYIEAYFSGTDDITSKISNK